MYVYGSFDDGTYQPTFTIMAKNANADQKEAFVKLIEDTLKNLVEALKPEATI